MTFLRCPTCRTLCDAERGRFCHGCGTALPAPSARKPRAAPEVEREARTDHRAVRNVGAILGGLVLLGVAAVGFDRGSSAGIRLAMLGIFLVGAAAIACTLLAPTGTAFNLAGRVVLQILAGVGIVIAILGAVAIGLLILIFVMCATGGFKIGG